MADIQYVVNQIMGQRFFDNEQVLEVEKFVQQHPEVTFEDLLCAKNHQ